MKQYRDICNKIIKEGRLSNNRTGVKTLAIFGADIRVNLAEEFPAITCKRAFVRGGVAELNWMLSGSTNVKDLHKRNVHFWDQWAIKGQHLAPKTLTEIRREFHSKTTDSWDDAIKRAVAQGATVPHARVCSWYGIDMDRLTDDRYRYVELEMDDLKNFLVGKCREGNDFPMTYRDAVDFVYSIWDDYEDEDYKDIPHKVAARLESTYGSIYTPHTEESLCIALMDKYGHTKEEAMKLIGHKPLDLVQDCHGINNMIAVKTCEEGDLGPVYGFNWRNWKVGHGKDVDQIKDLVHNLKNNPTSRRHVLSFWNVEHLPDERFTPQQNVVRGKMALAPCHWMCEFDVQLYSLTELLDKLRDEKHLKPHFGVSEEWTYEGIQALAINHGVAIGRLNIHPHMRSWDFPAGAPVNLVFYSTLCHMLAQQCNLEVGELWFTATNVHMYVDQVDIMRDVLKTTQRQSPKFKLTEKPNDIFSYSDNCYELIDYNPHPTVKVPVAL